MMLAADIGGTNMRIAVGDASGTLGEVKVAETPATYADGITRLCELADALPNRSEVTALTIGIAGQLDPSRSSLVYSPHLTGWAGVDLRRDFESAFGVPVLLENDAALAALGEARCGAGVGAPVLAYLTIGTGIGGARVVDGHIDRATHGFEPGHQYLGAAENAPEFEELVSGSAALRETGQSSKDITDEAFWKTYSERFAYGLYNTLLHWSPAKVVLGGSLAHTGAVNIDQVAAALARINRALPELPEIVYGTLEYPGLAGALAYGADHV